MSDIVQWLRARQRLVAWDSSDDIYRRAADEIERLRALNEKMLAWIAAKDRVLHDSIIFARATLIDKE